MFVGRGNASKGGTGKVFSNKGKSGPNVRGVPPNLSKAVSRHMIAMRFAGQSQDECDAWLENFIREIERVEQESSNG